MLDILLQLTLFSAKAIILVTLILILLVGIIAIISKSKESTKGKIILKNLNHKYREVKTTLLQEILDKKDFKKFLKELKAADKADKEVAKKNVYVIHFNGDIKASAVTALREEITAVLTIATPKDEVVVCVESAGGMVHAYGLASAQLARIKQQQIPLTVIIDKIAASGGYLMACVANKILAAPFAIIGSIGVIFQLPNFNRLLTEKNIDFEQITAGSFKRTLTMFGKNTPEGREKCRAEVEEIHRLFKNLIRENRSHLDIEKVSTGEHWLGTDALQLKLVDELTTSDDYLLAKNQTHHMYEITYHMKKPLLEKLTSSAAALKQQFFSGF